MNPLNPVHHLENVLAPAKLNLFLHITGRRDDGYHLLQSVFMLVDWCDVLHFETRNDGVLHRHDLTTPLPDEDLILRAARTLKQATGCQLGADIHVEKHIPAEAGMGGGSSDAASTLIALNRLWGLKLRHSQLARIGLYLGADVPFFLAGHNAWVEGIGEQITPLKGDATLPATRWLVIKPDQGLPTAQIFSSPHLKRDTNAATMADFAASSKLGFGHNDLQPVAQQLCPGVSQALHWLSQRGLQGRMTGSGSAVFAHLPDSAHIVLDDAPPGWQIRVCKNLEAHPLLGWVSRDD